MKKIFATCQQSVLFDIVLLLLRLVFGIAFVIFSEGKIKDPMGWMGPDPGYPAILVALAAISEFCGGIAVILGLVTRLAAFGIACTMVVATYTHISGGDPFVSMTGGLDYKLPLTYLVISLLFLVDGPGRFSVDRLIFGVHRKETDTTKNRF
jgi:putative oxidoreductase